MQDYLPANVLKMAQFEITKTSLTGRCIIGNTMMVKTVEKKQGQKKILASDNRF